MSIPWSVPSFSAEDKESVIKVLESGWMSEGKITREFERKICGYIGCREAVAFSSATTAMMTALYAHGIAGKGNKVIAPAYGFIAAVNVPLGLQDKVILSDSDSKTFNISPETVKSSCDYKKANAIIPVDVAGLPIDAKDFESFAKEESLALIEDAAETFGGECRNRKVGSHNHTTIFSFHIAKTITTVEGGCITTNNRKIAELCRKIKNHGVSSNKTRTHFEHFGFNFRTTDLQSAMGISQLARAEKFLKHRETLAKIYNDELQGVRGIKFQEVPEYATRHAWMFFPILVDAKKRDLIRKRLEKHGIGSRICWIPVHKQKYHKKIFSGEKFPVAEMLGKKNIALPMGNGISEGQIKYVCTELKKAVKWQ